MKKTNRDKMIKTIQASMTKEEIELIIDQVQNADCEDCIIGCSFVYGLKEPESVPMQSREFLHLKD